MKRITMLALFAAIVLTLAACGSNKAASTSSVQNTGTAAADQVDIKATSFKFDKAEYKIKKGVPTKLTLTSQSGIHGAAIDALNVKLESGNSTVITVNDAGTYEIHCYIPCGAGHTDMKAKLIVE